MTKNHRKHHPRYIDPFTDFGFKTIFINSANKNLLIAFVNAVLERVGEVSIEDVAYLSTEHLGLDAEHKKVVQDLECRTSDGKIIIVEMQRAMESDFRDRMAFYAFRTSIEGVKAGERYALQPVYTIVLMDAILRPDHPDFLHMATFRFENSSERFVRYPVILFLEAPKVPALIEPLQTNLEWWLCCLAHIKEWSQPPAILQSNFHFCHLFQAAELARFTNEEQKNYLKFHDSRRSMKYALEYQWQKGVEDGIMQGINQGLDLEKLDVIEKMLVNGLAWSLIQNVTSLDQAGFEALRIKLKR